MKVKFKLLNIIIFFLFSSTLLAFDKKYQGKLIDSIVQYNFDEFYSVDEIIRKIDQADVSQVYFSFSSKNIFEDIESERAKKIVNTIFSNPNKFKIVMPIYYYNSENLTKPNIDKSLIDLNRNKYTAIGEIHFRHADKIKGSKNSSGERSINPLGENALYFFNQLDKVYPTIPVFIHWEMHKFDQDLKNINQFFSKFPKRIFIINHLGFGTPEQIETILNSNPNVVFTISKRNEHFQYFRDSKLLQGPILKDSRGNLNPDWKKIFIKYPDRFLFATDAHKDYMWNKYRFLISEFRNLLADLPIEVAEKIAYKNSLIIFK